MVRSSDVECFSVINERRKRVIPLTGCTTLEMAVVMLMDSVTIAKAICERSSILCQHPIRPAASECTASCATPKAMLILNRRGQASRGKSPSRAVYTSIDKPVSG